MTKDKNRFMSVFIVLTALVLSGCIQRHPRSAYRAFYQDGLASVRVPTYEEIASVQDGQTDLLLVQPIERVWNVCLDLAAQSNGILGVEDDGEGGHRILFIGGRNLEYKRDRRFFVDRWLAISARPISENSTEVLVAFVSPKAARVALFSSDILPNGFKGDKSRSVSLMAGATFIESLQKSLAEDDYLRRLGNSSGRSTRGAPRAPVVKQIKGSESLEQKRADFVSARIRREQYIFNLPQLEVKVADIVQDFARAAKLPSRETRVFIVDGALHDTHVEPNGDIFVTIGLLDTVQNVDELAGVLAHELAHLYLNHESRRSRGVKIAGMSRNTTMFLGALGGAMIGGLIPTSTKPRSAAPQDTLLSNRGVLIGAALGLGGMYLGSQIGTGLGVGIGSFTVQRFSQKDELEADDYGAELLWAAGYDYHEFLKFLQSNAGLLEAPKKERR
jgi:hypothetical protein